MHMMTCQVLVLGPNTRGVTEGVDVEDIEAATSVHQHLGEALLADNGVDNEWVATWSGDVGSEAEGSGPNVATESRASAGGARSRATRTEQARAFRRA